LLLIHYFVILSLLNLQPGQNQIKKQRREDSLKIGFSLFWQLVIKQPDPNNPVPWSIAIPNIDHTLDRLKKLGISSIELKLTENIEFRQLFKAIEKLIDRGFNVTFHAPGRIHYPEHLNQQLKIFYEVSHFMNNSFGRTPLWVIHPLGSRTLHRAEIFSRTLEYLRQITTSLASLSANCALEILRNRTNSGKINIGDSYHEILKIINSTGDDKLGICWDFGHAYAMHERNMQDLFPPGEFLSRVMHCHVHDCADQKTHLPMGVGNIPVPEYIHRLKQVGFSGILNLEVVPHKIDDPENFMKYLENNIKTLGKIIAENR